MEEEHIPSNKEIELEETEAGLNTAAAIGENVPYAPVQIASKIYNKANAATGGELGKKLSKKVRLASKFSPPGTGARTASKMIKKLGSPKSQKAAKAFNAYNSIKNGKMPSSSKSSSSSSGGKKDGKFTIPLPIKAKIVLIAAILAIPLVGLMFFAVLFSDETKSSGTGAGSGSFMYGETCTTITVTNTGCNSNGENCTNIYDGEVELEEYIAGVVAAEVGDANNLEYYKAVAVAARTYLLSNISEDCTISGNSSDQSYMDVDDSSNESLIREAVEETEEIVLVEDGDLTEMPQPFSCAVNYDTNNCSGEQEHKMTKSEALSLINTNNYAYDDILKHYYGTGVEIKENILELSGIEGFVNPTRKIYCSSAYGYRENPINQGQEFHTGIDIGISGGEPIYAVKDGTISYVEKNITYINNCEYGYGNYIIIDHENGQTTTYAHIKYGTIPDNIEVGSSVSQGEIIGKVGSTGCSTGNHLHYEVKENGSTVDPAFYLDLTDAAGECQR